MKMTDLAVRGVSGGSTSDVVEPTGGVVSDGITRYVQGPWGLSVEASAEAQGLVPRPGSVAVLAWAGCTPCMVQPDPGPDQAWAACKECMVQPSSGVGPA
jgi:hypothetical protein